MREEVFKCKNGEYYARVWEAESGKVFASDIFSEKDHEEPASFETWDDAVARVQECVRDNENYYQTELPVTPLSMSGDVCRYGVTMLNDDAEEKLRELLDSGKDFDTGWGSCTKELEGVRFYARGDEITVSVSMEMDDMPELIYDATPDGIDLNEEEVDAIQDMCDDLDGGISSETIADRTIQRSSTYEEVIEAVRETREEASEYLEQQFEACKSCVSDYLRNREGQNSDMSHKLS